MYCLLFMCWPGTSEEIIFPQVFTQLFIPVYVYRHAQEGYFVRYMTMDQSVGRDGFVIFFIGINAKFTPGN